MSQTLAIDEQYITDNCRKAWNSWNYKQRDIWCLSHGLLNTVALYDYLPNEIKDALFCEYLDNANRKEVAHDYSGAS